MKILLTGTAGFIGMHVAERLLHDGHKVIGIDNLNAYYDVALKEARLARLTPHSTFHFHRTDITDEPAIRAVFATERPDRVIHLAAQAGVRYSLVNPQEYITTNIQGFHVVLEACRAYPVEHLVYASSSSVYGGNTDLPFSESQVVDRPVSLYAATKKANELMAHTYSHLYGLPATGLRFFTAYGPWGRPDMAYFKFTQDIMAGHTIEVFNNGELFRDFTYIDDIVEGVVRVLLKPPIKSHADLAPPYRVFNIGNSTPVPLMTFIETLEHALDRKAILKFLPMQLGDMHGTHADTRALEEWIGYRPMTTLAAGLARFAAWFHSANPETSSTAGRHP